MGLDLFLVKSENGFNDIVEGNGIDLCYGRRTWNIADFFMHYSTPVKGYKDYVWQVPLKAWDKFIDTARKFDLEEIEVLTLIASRGDASKEECQKIENFVYSFGDDFPWLGFDREAEVILSWVAQDDEVREAFRDKPNDIYLIVSY